MQEIVSPFGLFHVGHNAMIIPRNIFIALPIIFTLFEPYYMKNLFVALLMLVIAQNANAITVSTDCHDCYALNNTTNLLSFTGYDGQPLSVTGNRSQGLFGELVALGQVTVYATFLGQESGDINYFSLKSTKLFETNQVGETVQASFGPGLIDFSFTDVRTGSTIGNGYNHLNNEVLGFLFMNGQNFTQRYNSLGTFNYIVGFNDNGSGDADYDDFVVGLRFAAAPVPEPDGMPLMILGLAVLGFIFRSRTADHS